MLRINDDGSVGEITEEIYYKGLGIVAERNFRPHISCAKMTRDNHYLCVADLGMVVAPQVFREVIDGLRHGEHQRGIAQDGFPVLAFILTSV